MKMRLDRKDSVCLSVSSAQTEEEELQRNLFLPQQTFNDNLVFQLILNFAAAPLDPDDYRKERNAKKVSYKAWWYRGALSQF